MFDQRRILENDPVRLKGSCSEFLGMFSLLRHWVEVEAPQDADLQLAKRSFAKLCGIMDLILHVKRGIIAPAEGAQRMTNACCEYLRIHKVGGGLVVCTVSKAFHTFSCQAASPLVSDSRRSRR